MPSETLFHSFCKVQNNFLSKSILTKVEEELCVCSDIVIGSLCGFGTSRNLLVSCI